MAVVAAVVAGCGWWGDDDPPEAGTGDEAPTPPTGLPVAFAGGTDGWGGLHATADLLIGLGHGGSGPGGDLGAVVDLATGETWGLGRPDPEAPFALDPASVALDDELVVTGQACPPGTQGSDVEDPCTAPVTYRVDPREGTWTQVAVPPGTDMALDLFATPEGAVGIFRLSAVDGDEPYVLARLGDDGWERVGTVPPAVACATADTVFSVQDAFPPPAEGPAWTMTATSLVDGSAREVELPELPRRRLSVGSTLACGRDAPILALADADDWSSRVLVLDDDRWVEVEGIAPAPQEGTVWSVASGEAPVVAVMDSGVGPSAPDPPDLDPPTRAVVVRADGTTAPLLDDIRDVTFLPRGVFGPYVAVGPTYQDAPPGVDEPPFRDPVPLTLLPAQT